MLKTMTVLLAALVGAAPASVSAQRILDPRLDPPSPATLEPGDRVAATVRFRTPDGVTVRVFVRPLTEGAPTEEYAASASPRFAPGTGTAEGWFTVNRAPARVDAVRVQMVDAATGDVVGEHSVRVDYRFGSRPVVATVRPQAREPGEVRRVQPERVTEAPARVRPQLEARKVSPELLAKLGRYRPPAWRLPQPPAEDEGDGDGVPACFQAGVQTLPCDRVVSRHISAGGDVEVRCANGGTWTTTTEGSEIYTAPDGRRCSLAVLYSTALPPAEPPTAIGDSEWAGQVHAWLDGVGLRLLLRIQALVGTDGLENYQSFEEESAADLYQRVDLRLAYLDRLMEHL